MRYFGCFSEKSDVASEFQVDIGDINILIAVYSQEDYEGSAFVLFYGEDNQLYEVNGGHCSCYGLEEQWDPEATSWEAIRHRFEKGHLFPYGWDDVDPARKQVEYLLNLEPLLD